LPSSGADNGCNNGRNMRSIQCPTTRGERLRWRSTPGSTRHSPHSSPANRRQSPNAW
jgi:hypothetical protein